MNAIALAKKLGFRRCAQDDAQVFVSPDLAWIVIVRGCWTGMGPVDSKPFESITHDSPELADAYAQRMIQSIHNTEARC